jgi:hypothetical protein
MAGDTDSTFSKSADLSVFEKKEIATGNAAETSEIHSTQEKNETPVAAQVVEEEKEDAAAEEPEPEYPTSWKLAMITIALCLSVFCMALVSSARFKCRSLQLTHVRTIRLLPPLFLGSRINSRH